MIIIHTTYAACVSQRSFSRKRKVSASMTQMGEFEFETSDEARSDEATLRTIDAISVDFRQQASAATLDPKAIVPAILQVVYGRYLIEVTPEAAAQGLLDNGFTEDQLFCALFYATGDGAELLAATRRINHWIRSADKSATTLTPNQVKTTLSCALMKVTTRQRIASMMTGILLCGASAQIRDLLFTPRSS